MKEIIDIGKCQSLIKAFEIESGEENTGDRLSYIGFINYLTSQENFIENLEESVYQNMDLPIFYYFINSSHNTFEKIYLTCLY